MATPCVECLKVVCVCLGRSLASRYTVTYLSPIELAKKGENASLFNQTIAWAQETCTLFIPFILVSKVSRCWKLSQRHWTTATWTGWQFITMLAYTTINHVHSHSHINLFFISCVSTENNVLLRVLQMSGGSELLMEERGEKTCFQQALSISLCVCVCAALI